jgi:hypothetical protein
LPLGLSGEPIPVIATTLFFIESISLLTFCRLNYAPAENKFLLIGTKIKKNYN